MKRQRAGCRLGRLTDGVFVIIIISFVNMPHLTGTASGYSHWYLRRAICCGRMHGPTVQFTKEYKYAQIKLNIIVKYLVCARYRTLCKQEWWCVHGCVHCTRSTARDAFSARVWVCAELRIILCKYTLHYIILHKLHTGDNHTFV